MAAIWTTQRERGHPAPLALFTWIALKLGRPVARLLLWPIACYFVVAGGEARAASRDYLRRVLGREARIGDGLRHVHCFASVILDRLYLLNDRHDLFEIDVDGADVIQRAMAGKERPDGRRTAGAFVVGAHLGSFEAVRAAGRGEKDLRVSMVMYEDNAQYLNRVFAAINPALNESIIALGRIDSMLRVKRALDDGGLVGMLADRTLGEEAGTGAVRDVMLFGAPVSIPVGPFRMAAMLKRPMVFIVGVYRGGNRYTVRYEPLHDFSVADPAISADAAIDAVIAAYVARLEHYCREAPYNWCNFYDYWNDRARPGTHAASWVVPPEGDR